MNMNEVAIHVYLPHLSHFTPLSHQDLEVNVAVNQAVSGMTDLVIEYRTFI